MRVRHLTARRAWNRLRVEWDTHRRIERVRSLPTFVIVEPCNLCNLRCPLCPTGQNLAVDRGVMQMSTFRRVVDQLYRYTRHLNLFYLGEPLLCRELPGMIKCAHDHNMRVSVSSNMNHFDVGMADNLIDSALDNLIVSLDGATPEVYQHYRVGGDVNRVIENVELLLTRKRKRGADLPCVRLQFVVLRHNEHELPAVRALGKRLGVEVFVRQGILGGCGHSPPVRKDLPLAREWLTQNPKYQSEYDYFSDAPTLKQGACPYLWKVVTINYDGSVLPCCWAYDNRHSFGNILEQDFAEIWNNARVRSARRLFAQTSNGAPLPRTICHECIMYPHQTETRP